MFRHAKKLPLPQPFAPCLPSASDPTGVRNKTVGNVEKKRVKKGTIVCPKARHRATRKGMLGSKGLGKRGASPLPRGKFLEKIQTPGLSEVPHATVLAPKDEELLCWLPQEEDQGPEAFLHPHVAWWGSNEPSPPRQHLANGAPRLPSSKHSRNPLSAPNPAPQPPHTLL